VRGLRRAWSIVLTVDRFVRIHFVGFASMLCLLGAASVTPAIEARSLAALVAVALCFHVFSYVLNDVIDLPIDRTQPLRRRDPLVRGAIRPGQALAFALLQIPLSFAVLLAAEAAPFAFLALGGGYAGMTAYNLWGKRCPVPLLTDAAQGLGWGSLALVGAGLEAATPPPLAILVCAYGAGHIFLINGIHGGLRDLDNDLAHGSRTAAIFLGARPTPSGPVAPPAVWIFSLGVQAALAALLLGALWAGAFGYSDLVRSSLLGIVGGLCGICVFLAHRVARPQLPGWDVAMRLHLFLIPFTLIVACLPRLPIALQLALLAVYVLPVLTLEWTHRILREAWERVRRVGQARKAAP
jgi:4-hydroxybenzoate polyprenyltransferase